MGFYKDPYSDFGRLAMELGALADLWLIRVFMRKSGRVKKP